MLVPSRQTLLKGVQAVAVGAILLLLCPRLSADQGQRAGGPGPTTPQAAGDLNDAALGTRCEEALGLLTGTVTVETSRIFKPLPDDQSRLFGAPQLTISCRWVAGPGQRAGVGSVMLVGEERRLGSAGLFWSGPVVTGPPSKERLARLALSAMARATGPRKSLRLCRRPAGNDHAGTIGFDWLELVGTAHSGGLGYVVLDLRTGELQSLFAVVPPAAVPKPRLDLAAATRISTALLVRLGHAGTKADLPYLDLSWPLAPGQGPAWHLEFVGDDYGVSLILDAVTGAVLELDGKQQPAAPGPLTLQAADTPVSLDLKATNLKGTLDRLNTQVPFAYDFYTGLNEDAPVTLTITQERFENALKRILQAAGGLTYEVRREAQTNRDIVVIQPDQP